ncbi:hypothetical protein ILUMI_07316 [Ignelater luminosus]|uniref:Protein unc-13 homolog 4B n=1 Tax=Ignelater luminosus TaxID=2038154 RepID=A0A8K0GI63_IGNLU|nr:hypothetical protein ILUMI_07316 [Ignelater luminosus]
MATENAEDEMWKSVYDKLKKQKSLDDIAHEKRIQQVDGGFFERFGSMLQEHSELATEQEYQENLRVHEAAAQIIPHLSIGEGESTEIKIDETIPEDVLGEQSSDTISIDNELTISSLDSEQGEGEGDDKSDYFAVGMNIEELYSEILYEILHNVGCDVSYEVGQTALFSYIQEAFKIPNEKHNELLSAAERKEPPELLLNVEVIEAKDLVAKDSNGLSDPFVTLYLASNASRRYNTSVKPETLNPVWEEHFALPVSEKNCDDMLCLEVWDFDPAETVREKFGKIFSVKGVRGARKLLKEIAVTATMGQHENELVGTARIPLKSIPSSGMTMWYSLDKKSKINRRGVVKVRLSFGSEKNSQVAAQEYKHLLQVLLLHELESAQICVWNWKGNFSPQGDVLLTQHKIQSGLSPTDIALAQWTVYSSVHRDHPLSFSVFSQLLDKIIKPLQLSTVAEDDVKMFWDSTKKLLPSCFATIRKIRKRKVNAKVAAQQLLEVLNIISKLSCLEPPEGTDLFPSNMYGWLSYKEEGPNWDIRGTLNDAVAKGARDWFRYILENNTKQDDTEEETLIYLNKIIQLVRTDLQKAVEFYDKMFQEVVNLQYAKTLYNLYQAEVATLVEPQIVTICKSLKKISYEWNCIPSDTTSEPLALGTKLFELYLALQRFVILGKGLNPTESETYHIRNFHKWFHGGVAQWLDIAVFKALQRIDKAVELDNLTPVDDTVKYSSSALDTLTIFHQIKIFWDQLNWPDVEGSYTFIAKIIDDICRCCVFYADKVDHKVDGMGEIQDSYEKRFEVTREWCLAINNIDYVGQSLKPFAEQLGLEDILKQLADIRCLLEAQRCRETLQTVLDNSIDTVKNKIIELLETVARKMTPAMKKLLIEGAELLHQDSNSIDKVMRYLDNNLATLHEELNEDNFERILEIIWDYLGNILTDLIQSNIERRRPPSFFANLRETLELMVKCFKQTEETSTCGNLRRVQYLLEINGMETTQLIHQVHLDRWKEQQKLKTSPYGELTVRLQFQNHDLKIEVINARDLIPMDSNGFSDSFVRIFLLPEEKFTNVQKPKTQTHNKNLFPLYDETFTLNLSPEQRKVADGLVLFSVKDKDFLGMNNQFIGETFVHFNEIPDTTNPITSLSQVRLLLNRPTNFTTDAIKALENRQGDKLAKEFVKRLKQKKW